MSDIQKIKIGEQEYTLRDGSAVAFDEAQALTEEQKQQARANIGANTLIVTITDDVASHTSAEIYAHVQSGGTAVLLDGGAYYNLVWSHEGTAMFGSESFEEGLFDGYGINSNGSFDYYSRSIITYDALEEKITRPATAKVGQTIVVKSVDANGRPVEWEAADLPSDTHINSLIDAKLGTTFIEIDTLLGGES